MIQQIFQRVRSATDALWNGKTLDPVTARNQFTRRKLQELNDVCNSFLHPSVNPPTAGDVSITKNGWMFDLTRTLQNLVAAAGGTTGPYTLATAISPNYLTAVLSAVTYSIAKPYKLRTSLTGVSEFGVTNYFFYGDGSSTAQGSAIFSALGITPDGQNVMRLKTTDATQTAFPTTTALTANTGAGGGYVRSMGELQMVLPMWATAAPADLVYATSGTTGLTDGGGNAITLLAEAEERQWCKIDQSGPVYGGTFANPNGNITPSDPTTWNIYYQDGALKVWTWSVAGQNWFEVI